MFRPKGRVLEPCVSTDPPRSVLIDPIRSRHLAFDVNTNRNELEGR